MAVGTILAVGSLVSSGIGFRRSRKAAKKQDAAAAQAAEIGRQNAALIREETAEEFRRTEQAQEQIAGQSKAMAATSGLDTKSESIENVMSDMDTAHAESLEWLEKSGESRAEMAELTGEYTAAQGRAGADQTRAAGISGLATSVGNINTTGLNQGWWK